MNRDDREFSRSSFFLCREDRRVVEEDQDQPWIDDRTRNTVRLDCVVLRFINIAHSGSGCRFFVPKRVTFYSIIYTVTFHFFLPRIPCSRFLLTRVTFENTRTENMSKIWNKILLHKASFPDK